jgi:hypothetical protein
MSFEENFKLITIMNILLVHSIGRCYNNFLNNDLIKKWELSIVIFFICVIAIKKMWFS